MLWVICQKSRGGRNRAFASAVFSVRHFHFSGKSKRSEGNVACGSPSTYYTFHFLGGAAGARNGLKSKDEGLCHEGKADIF
jgi:hypothetical protein